MSKNKQKDLIFRAAGFIGNEDYEQAHKYLQQALQENPRKSYKALAMYYYGVMKSNVENNIGALNDYLKALGDMDAPNNGVPKIFKRAIYRGLSDSAFKLGLRKETFYFAGLAYRMYNKPYHKHILLFRYLYCLVAGNTSADTIMQELSKMEEDMQKIIRQFPCGEVLHKSSSPGNKIHIAYISPDFREHVMNDFYFAFLKHYDRSKFFVTCVHLDRRQDAYTEQIRSMVDRFEQYTDLPYHKLAGKLRDMQIDIAVDLAGFTGNTGIFAMAYRVATVQISGLGWMETTGMKEIDYLITDRYLDESGHSYITEKPLYLNSCFCFTPGEGKQDLPISVGAPCRSKGYITFGSFNRLIKITDEMLIAWREIMRLVPDSRLLLKSMSFAHESTCQYTLDRMAKIGLDRERIILEEPSKDYMQRYLDVDIALDTYPYCGGGTTCDALYMGVPVVSIYGDRRSSKFGRSILSAAGLEELAVDNADAYVNLAVSLAQDWDTLDTLHRNLRTMLEKSDLMNGEKYTRELEAQYEEILKQKQAE